MVRVRQPAGRGQNWEGSGGQLAVESTPPKFQGLPIEGLGALHFGLNLPPRREALKLFRRPGTQKLNI